MTNTDINHVDTFVKMLGNCCPKYPAGSTFRLLVTIMANMISAIGDPLPERAQRRVNEARGYIAEIGGLPIFKELVEMVQTAFETNPAQDFLGSAYHKLSINDKKHFAQFFTPYTIAESMATMQDVNSDHWQTIADPCAGSGVMLIAHANVAKKAGKQPEINFFYFANDIDRICCCMSVIQLSMLGLAGIVSCSDALDIPLNKLEVPFTDREDDIYYLPGCIYPEWQLRMLLNQF